MAKIKLSNLIDSLIKDSVSRETVKVSKDIGLSLNAQGIELLIDINGNDHLSIQMNFPEFIDFIQKCNDFLDIDIDA